MRRFAYWIKLWKVSEKTDIDFKLKKNIINENIWNYWKLIPGVFQLKWYAKESQLQKDLGIKTLNDNSLEFLRKSKRRAKFLSDIPNYDI